MLVITGFLRIPKDKKTTFNSSTIDRITYVQNMDIIQSLKEDSGEDGDILKQTTGQI